jgi:hypothetical protein
LTLLIALAPHLLLNMTLLIAPAAPLQAPLAEYFPAASAQALDLITQVRTVCYRLGVVADRPPESEVCKHTYAYIRSKVFNCM